MSAILNGPAVRWHNELFTRWLFALASHCLSQGLIKVQQIDWRGEIVGEVRAGVGCILVLRGSGVIEIGARGSGNWNFSATNTELLLWLIPQKLLIVFFLCANNSDGFAEINTSIKFLKTQLKWHWRHFHFNYGVELKRKWWQTERRLMIVRSYKVTSYEQFWEILFVYLLDKNSSFRLALPSYSWCCTLRTKTRMYFLIALHRLNQLPQEIFDLEILGH